MDGLNLPIGFLLAIIVLGYYVFYRLIVGALSKNRTLGTQSNSEFAPHVSVIIPTYNEIRMIEKRVKNFDIVEYPRDRLDVLFVRLCHRL